MAYETEREHAAGWRDKERVPKFLTLAETIRFVIVTLIRWSQNRQFGEIGPDQGEAPSLEGQSIAARGLCQHRLGPIEPYCLLKTPRAKQRL